MVFIKFMLVGIDAHNLEGDRTGVGRYLFNLLKEWSKLKSGEWQMANGKFILYFKDEVPADMPKSDIFEFKLLSVSSTAKFTHWDLPRSAKKDKVDILFCPAYIAPLWCQGKIALTLHDIIYEAHPEWFNWPSPADKILLKWVSKKSARKAAIIFTPSEFSRQEVLSHYRVAPDKVINIPLAADPELSRGFDNSAHKAEEIKALKISYGIRDKFIFFVGSIFSRRHLSEVIAAFSRLTKDAGGDNWQLLLSGADHTPGQAVSCLSKEINKRSGREAILQVDFSAGSELKLLYSACAFFIWLSDYEGFGLPVAEAMSVGVPVITSDSTSLKEVAGGAALLIKDNFDVEKIYQAMKQLASDENLRQELIIKGREQAAKFSWHQCAEETLHALLHI